MTIFTNRDTLEDLYSSSKKLVIASSDRAILKNLSGLSVINIYEFHNTPEGGVLLPWGQERRTDAVELRLAPVFCFGFLVASEVAKNELDVLVTWWQSLAKQENVPSYLELTPENPELWQEQIWQELFLRAVGETELIAKRIGELQRQYLELRSIHEDVQNAFATVEDFLCQTKIPQLQLAFENPPAKDVAISSDGTGLAELQQLLPIPSRGLAAIDLHIAKKDPHASGTLEIAIEEIDEEICLAKWQVPYQNIPEKWLHLDLPAIRILPKRDIKLKIKWINRIGLAPYVSIGEAQPIPEVQLTSDRGKLARSLAFRLWTGLPGTRQVVSPYLEEAQRLDRYGVKSSKFGFLGDRAIASAIAVTPNLPTDDFAHIQIVNNGAKLLLHPRPEGELTIAILPFVFPAEAKYLRATVATEHPEASEIEYALALITDDVDPHTCFAERPSVPIIGRSPWIKVEPNVPAQIALALDNPAKKNYHIVLATRLPPQSSLGYAWAHWLNFYVDRQVQEIPLFEEIAPTTPSSISYEGQIPLVIREIVPAASKKELTLEQIIKSRDASLDTTQDNFPHVSQIENSLIIQVHPRTEGETIALLPESFPQGAIKASAIVCTENADASPIEYAMAIIKEDDDLTAQLAIASTEAAVTFSGWHRVEPDCPTEIVINLPEPAPSNYHLVLATRLPEGGYKDNAWARWLTIEFV